MPTLTIKPGATVLVTGANGLIGSHIVDQLLKREYHVRGVVRDTQKCQWLYEYFDGKYSARFEMVSVPDMTIEGCYDKVIEGAEGFIHVAAPLGNLGGDKTEVVVSIAVKSNLNALKAAAKTPSIKSVVYTSSSIAATSPSVGVEKVLDMWTFNEEIVKKGWNHPKDEPDAFRTWYTYGTMKTESEKACWKWIEENKPGFAFNAVLPNANFSKLLVPKEQGAPSTIAWAKSAFTGEQFEFLKKVVEPQFYISTEDCALLHISALIHSGDVVSERLFGFAERWNWNDILTVYRKAFPDRKFPENLPNPGVDETKPPTQRAEEIVKWVKDGQGWDALEPKVLEMARQFAELY